MRTGRGIGIFGEINGEGGLVEVEKESKIEGW